MCPRHFRSPNHEGPGSTIHPQNLRFLIRGGRESCKKPGTVREGHVLSIFITETPSDTWENILTIANFIIAANILSLPMSPKPTCSLFTISTLHLPQSGRASSIHRFSLKEEGAGPGNDEGWNLVETLLHKEVRGAQAWTNPYHIVTILTIL